MPRLSKQPLAVQIAGQLRQNLIFHMETSEGENIAGYAPNEVSYEYDPENETILVYPYNDEDEPEPLAEFKISVVLKPVN